jgi:hypothetical protein
VSAPPLFVLGVGRSGTTLLRVMLDRHSRLAIPDESFFITQLADRHRGPVDVDEFADDLRRLPALREWGVPVDEVSRRLRPGSTPGEAIAAVYEVYAALRGKERWGDKTPLYMQHLSLLQRLFPGALYVHLIRDGRDAAVSFLALPEGIATRTRAQPRDAADFACLWRSEVLAARSLGRRVGPERYVEIRYERLVEHPERELRSVCALAGLEFEPGMLEHAVDVDVSEKPHQQSLLRPLTPGLRDWRSELAPGDVQDFEHVAGDLLRELGYEAEGHESAAGRMRRSIYAWRVRLWNLAASATRRSPLWRRRHPLLS